MKTTQYFLGTFKETPKHTDVMSHKLMLRAGLIRKIASGLYTWLPTGLRVLRKMENIIRDEMNKIGGIEIFLPIVQPAKLWKISGRWTQYGPELLRFKNRNQREYILSPTHEELIAEIISKEIVSYKELPLILYQIQSKFRDEIRPRYGLFRSREFIMKDGYSFHVNLKSLQNTYQIICKTYHTIFNKFGLDYRMIKADSGNIGGNISHEFHAIVNNGEDIITRSTISNYAANIDSTEAMFPIDNLSKVVFGDNSLDDSGKLSMHRSIEIGHVFQLGNKYFKRLSYSIQGKNKKNMDVMMGCYGIGVSRLVAAVIEQKNDKNGIIWPDSLAPFSLAIIPINMYRFSRVAEFSEEIYNYLLKYRIDVLLDDRDESLGVKFADIELIGIPHSIIISEKSLNNEEVEYKHRGENIKKIIKIENILDFFQNIL